MIGRRSLLGAVAFLAPATLWSADLNQKNPARLQAAAVQIAVSGRPAELAVLGGKLSEAAFLRRLDPERDSVTRLGEVFRALAEHPSSATAALCRRVAASKSFGAIPARWNYLLAALAAVRPMAPESAPVFLRLGRTGYLEVAVPLLAGNATPEALGVMEALFTDSSQSVEQRVSAAHWGVFPNRVKPGLVEACARILAHPGLDKRVSAAIVESLFENRPAEWFGKRSPAPQPPPWSAATPETRAALKKLADSLR